MLPFGSVVASRRQMSKSEGDSSAYEEKVLEASGD